MRGAQTADDRLGGPRPSAVLPTEQPWSAEDVTGARGERRDAAENRQRILAAARALFAEQGVDAVSMNQIARRAGLGPGTLYRRYAHKGLLCAALLEENWQGFQTVVAARLASAPLAEPALTQLELLLTRLLAFNEDNGPLLGAIADAACGERRSGRYHSPLYRWLHQTVAAILQRAVATGEVRSVDVEWFADALLAPLAIDLYLFQRQERGFAPERIITALRQLLDGVRTAGVATGTTGHRAQTPG